MLAENEELKAKVKKQAAQIEAYKQTFDSQKRSFFRHRRAMDNSINAMSVNFQNGEDCEWYDDMPAMKRMRVRNGDESG